MSAIDELSREKLLVLLKNFAKNWLAHDGLWFQAAASPVRLTSIRTSITAPGNSGLKTRMARAVEGIDFQIRH